MEGGLVRKVMLFAGMALSLMGSLLAIFGIFLRWGFGVSIFRPPDISGWDMITTTIVGNLNVFLVLIGGAIAFSGWLTLALFRKPSLAQKIALCILWLGMALTAAGSIWSVQKYGSVPPGLFLSMLGSLLLTIGVLLLSFKPQR